MDFMFKNWKNPHALDGPLLKIKRANKHLESIDGFIKTYESFKPHRAIVKLNADKTFYEYRLQAIFPPFLDIGIAIGEFAYQLRSALDSIIYGLAVFPASLTAQELERAERSTSFPICPTQNPSFVNGQLKFVPDSIRDKVAQAIDPFQPYHAGDRAERGLLAVLDEINRRDKHRLLRPAGSLIHMNTANIAEGIRTTIDDDVSDGDVFALVPAELDPKIEFDPRLSFEVKIDIPKPAGGLGITNLPLIYELVSDRIVPALTEFFPPRD